MEAYMEKCEPHVLHSDKKGSHTKTDNLRGGLWGGHTNSET